MLICTVGTQVLKQMITVNVFWRQCILLKRDQGCQKSAKVNCYMDQALLILTLPSHSSTYVSLEGNTLLSRENDFEFQYLVCYRHSRRKKRWTTMTKNVWHIQINDIYTIINMFNTFKIIKQMCRATITLSIRHYEGAFFIVTPSPHNCWQPLIFSL